MTLLDAAADLAATQLTPDVGVRRRTLVGRVLSVHRAAIYVVLDRTAELLVVAIEPVGGVPGGMLVRGSSDLAGMGVAAGMSFERVSNGWAIPAASLRINADRATTWSPALPQAARVVASPAVDRRIAAAHLIGTARCRPGGLWPTAETD